MGMRPGNVGMDHLGPFWMNFRKTSEGGEGVVSHQKDFVAVFLVTLRGKNYEFSGKEGAGGVHSNPKSLLKKSAKGVQRLFGSFSKIHPKWFKNRPFRSQAKPNVPG